MTEKTHVIRHTNNGQTLLELDISTNSLTRALEHAVRGGVSLANADLAHLNLCLIDLKGADLQRARLVGTTLSGANLREANLSYATLTGARFINSDLSGVNLNYAALARANFEGADLQGASLYGITMKGVVGNCKEIRSMHLEKYPIAFTADLLQIGCKRYTIEQWRGFNNEMIDVMSPSALKDWKKWKEFIFMAIEMAHTT